MRRRPHDEPDDDPDAPLESDQDPDDVMDVVDCPYCRKPISGQAEQCPHCGNYISLEDTPPTKQTRRLIGAIVLVAILLTIVASLLR